MFRKILRWLQFGLLRNDNFSLYAHQFAKNLQFLKSILSEGYGQPSWIAISKKNTYIRKQGQDFKKGAILFKRGHKINARDIGLIISAGINKVSVYKKPNVLLIATGNELISPKKEPKKGEIYASSLYVIKELIHLCGANCKKFLIVKDDEKLIKQSIRNINNILYGL